MRTVAAMNEHAAAVADASTPAGTSVAVRTAAAIQALIGLGFGGGATWTVVHLLQNGELPMTPWGFRSMAGPFERLGEPTFAVLGGSLAAVCALDVVAGVWLWQQRRRGLRLGLLTAVPQIALGLGFALPIQLVSVPLRVGLALAGRGSLR
jgi:hypothetical protein